MVKTTAERMREYRKRLKEDPDKYEDYLSKAKRRKKDNYVLVNRLTYTQKKKKTSRANKKVYVKRHRQKYRMVDVNAEMDSNLVEIRYDTQGSSEPMIVNLPSRNRRNGPRKRLNRALSKKKKEIGDLKAKFERMKQKYIASLRKLQRIKMKHSDNKTSSSDDTESVVTPRKKHKRVDDRCRYKYKQKAIVREQLLFANVVRKNVRSYKKGVKRTNVLRGFIGVQLLNKYRAELLTLDLYVELDLAKLDL